MAQNVPFTLFFSTEDPSPGGCILFYTRSKSKNLRVHVFGTFLFQHMQNEVKKELDRLLYTSTESVHSSQLAEDEITAVKRNLQTNNVEARPAEVNIHIIIITSW